MFTPLLNHTRRVTTAAIQNQTTKMLTQHRFLTTQATVQAAPYKTHIAAAGGVGVGLMFGIGVGGYLGVAFGYFVGFSVGTATGIKFMAENPEVFNQVDAASPKPKI